MTATWQDVLKENLVGRVIATCEMGISFRGTIDRVEVKDNFFYIYPKAWFRLYSNWEPWETQKTKELGYPEPVVVKISGENAGSPDINYETGEIYFYILFRGEVYIRRHDCVIQADDEMYGVENGIAESDLVYSKPHGGWCIRTIITPCDDRNFVNMIFLRVKHCPECGQLLPKF